MPIDQKVFLDHVSGIGSLSVWHSADQGGAGSRKQRRLGIKGDQSDTWGGPGTVVQTVGLHYSRQKREVSTLTLCQFTLL